MMDMENKLITYMDTLWVSVEENTLTIGIKEDALAEATEIYHADLPPENSDIEGEEICGEIHTDDGPINLYSPVSGTVLEVNSTVINNPKILFEETEDDGWLLRLEYNDEADIERFLEENAETDED